MLWNFVFGNLSPFLSFSLSMAYENRGINPPPPSSLSFWLYLIVE